jgi:hypothetical protein
LIDYINRSRKIFFKEEPKTGSKLIQYHLKRIVKELKDKLILSILYGRLFKIVSKYNISEISNLSVDTFVDLAEDLIQNYFYALYKKHKKVWVMR